MDDYDIEDEYEYAADDGWATHRGGYTNYEDEDIDDIDYDDADIISTEQKQELKEEINAYERVGHSSVDFLLESGSMDKITLRNASPKDRFLLILNAVCTEYITNTDDPKSLRLTNEDKKKLLETAAATPNIGYKNPYGFLLGYVASSAGRNMNKVEHTIKNYLSVGAPASITPPDVIRYARYWTLYLR